MRFSIRHLVALCAIVVLVTACGESSTPSNEASMTIVHATATLDPIDVVVGGDPVVIGLEYGEASPPVAVPSGIQRIVVHAGTDTIADFEAAMTTAHVNALIVANGSAEVVGTVIPDTGTVAAARANLRLVNVVGTNLSDPTLLELLINFPGVGPDSTARLGGLDSKIASYSSLMYFDAGHFRLRYVLPGTTTVLAEAEFDIAVGQVKVAVLERAANGTYTVTIVEETGG